MSWLEFEGHRIWYRRSGAGTPLVFLHHGEADNRLWDHQYDHFRLTHDVVVPDLLGFGLSDKPDVAYTLDLYARMTGRLVDGLDLAPATLVGTCVGAAMSLRYAYEHPDRVRSLVLINTLTEETLAAGVLGPTVPWARHAPTRALTRFVVKYGLLPRRLRERPMRAAFGDRVDEQWLAYFAGQRWADRRAIRTWISQGEQMATYLGPRADPPVGFPPVCSVWGAANRILPLTAGRRFNAVLRPDRVVEVPGAGHMAPLERPAEVNAAIESFLNEQERLGAPAFREG